eukprot:276675-Rhodomonas_salina.3
MICPGQYRIRHRKLHVGRRGLPELSVDEHVRGLEVRVQHREGVQELHSAAHARGKFRLSTAMIPKSSCFSAPQTGSSALCDRGKFLRVSTKRSVQHREGVQNFIPLHTHARKFVL